MQSLAFAFIYQGSQALGCSAHSQVSGPLARLWALESLTRELSALPQAQHFLPRRFSLPLIVMLLQPCLQLLSLATGLSSRLLVARVRLVWLPRMPYFKFLKSAQQLSNRLLWPDSLHFPQLASPFLKPFLQLIWLSLLRLMSLAWLGLGPLGWLLEF